MTKRKYKFLDKGRREIIASRIDQVLDIAIRETGMKQWQIADEISVSKNSISNWRKGRSIPSDRDFDRLLAFLGKLDPPITEDFFYGAFVDDPFTEDPDYVAEMGKELAQYAKDIELDLDFLRFLMKNEGFEEVGCLWGPIWMKGNQVPSDPGKLKVHERLTSAESKVARAAGDFRMGNRVLSKTDLNIIKEWQGFIVRVMYLSFIKRRLEMEGEVKAADELRQKKYLKAKENAGDAELSNRDMILTVGEMGTIDKYYREFMKEIPDDTLITEIPEDKMSIRQASKQRNGGGEEK